VGFRMYKSVRLGKGVRLNLSKTGVGMSVGGSGVRYSVHSSGRSTRTVGIPGSGISYRDTSSGSRSRTRSSPRRQAPTPPVVTFPKAGLFAPKGEKAFVRGVTAYMHGDYQEALTLLQESKALDPGSSHVAEEYFAAFCMTALNDQEGAMRMLEEVLASDVPLPDRLMVKYGVGGFAQVSVTPQVVAEVPQGSLAAGLLLAELYQASGKSEKAIEVLESLGSIAPNPFFALSLADLYEETERWDDVLRVTEQFTSNDDDPTCQLLVYRGKALREKGLGEAALEVLKQALKSKKRHQVILDQARFERALTYEALGKNGMARKDLERIYAANPGYADVAQRLGQERG